MFYFCCIVIESQRLQKLYIYIMSRTVPWRSKPTTLITQMIPVANQYKLYLIHQTGPTSFVFKDDNDNKFKVSIGSTVACSCGIVQNDHCIHTLYVLLKKFKVPETNPILWQASYLDSQLEGLVQFKFSQKKREERKKHSYRKAIQIDKNNQDADDFPPLEDDEMCPICYEQMNGECYSTCKTCKKSLHTKCFKIWTRHKEDSGLAVTCPMCRSNFQNPMTIIFKDLQRWQARFSTHKGTLCKGCGMKNIKGLLYKCLQCSNVQLCKMCYEGNQHIDHQRFVVKQLANQGWKLAPIRIRKTKKQLFQPIKEINIKQLADVEGEQLILELLPTLKQYTSAQQVTDLGIVGNEILPKQLCFRCRTGGNQLMRRLNCGHYLHQQCLKSMIINKEYICELDSQIICPGYFQAMGIKVSKKKKPVESVVLKNEEEIGRIKDSINNLQINGFVPKTKISQKRNNSMGSAMNHNRSKDKHFRIMKKTVIDKKSEESQPFGVGNLGMIMITGLGHQTQHTSTIQGTNNPRQNANHYPPKMRSNILNLGGFR